MDRIDNVDLREALDRIALNNTFFHRDNDLGISIEQMERAAKLRDYADKTLIWVSYPGGIDCYPEREVFQKDTRSYNGVLYHGKENLSEHGDRRLAYAVDVTGVKDGILYGSLYETDIREYSKIVKDSAVPSNMVRIYEDSGRETTMPRDEFNRRYPLDLVKMAYWRHEPDDPTALKAALDDMWNSHRDEQYVPCDLWAHTSRLHDDRDVFYSGQIMRDLNKLREPNSPDRQFFTTPLNPYVAAAFNPEELGRLLDKLPYKSAEFSIKRGQLNMQVVIPREEVQLDRHKQQGKPTVMKDGREIPVTIPPNDKREPPEKPSILEALKQGAEKSRQQNNNKTQKKSKETEI